MPIYMWTGTQDPIDILTNVKYYFPMQGDIKDYSWNNADLTVAVGSASNITYGTNYNTLNGVVLRNGTLTYSSTVSQTIGIWGNLTTGTTQFLSADFDGNGTAWWGMWISYNNCQVVNAGSALGAWNYSTLVNTGWRFVVLTFDSVNKEVRSYLDGTLLGTYYSPNITSVRSTKGISIWRFGLSNTYYYWDIGITFLTASPMSTSDVTAFYNATKWLYGVS